MPYKKEDEKLIKELERDKKYSGRVLFWSGLGLTIMGLDYYFSNKFGMESLYKSIKDMNFNELVHNTLFGISSLGVVGSGAMYGMIGLIEFDLKNNTKRITNNLEEELEGELED